MELYKEVFNAASIYDMLFFNVTGVLEKGDLNNLSEEKYKVWEKLSKGDLSQEFYQNNAINYPEFTKIVAISYATVELENGTLKRKFKKISNDNEYLVLATFFDVLYEISSDTGKAYSLCGDNILSYDVPLLIKRFLVHLEEFSDKKLPAILKECLTAKPWDGLIIDTRSVWKFNSLMPSNEFTQDLYCELMPLKKDIELLSLVGTSLYYWNSVDMVGYDNSASRLEYLSHQSATKVNLAIQLMNKLRKL